MFLADTNVLSEVTKIAPNVGVVSWMRQQSSLLVSTVSIMELEFGIARASGVKKHTLLLWFESLLASSAHVVVPIDAPVARAAGQLKRLAEANGRPRPLADLLIAATARVQGAVVVTRNTGDFEGLGISLLNPFQ